MAISLMCAGDGLADIVGRRWGASARLPWNPAKSWAGSVAMFLGACCPVAASSPQDFVILSRGRKEHMLV